MIITSISASEYSSLYDYYTSLDTSCTNNEDCVIQNVENCCGYYPQCINTNAKLDSSVVAEICEGSDDECGSKFSVSYCRCQGETTSKLKCVGFSGRPIINCGDGNCFENESIVLNPDYCVEDCGGVQLEEPPETEVVNETEVTEDPKEIDPEVGVSEEQNSTIMYWVIGIVVVIIILIMFIVMWKSKKKLD